jgi:tetratricopeptide (TPR) repeat protein
MVRLALISVGFLIAADAIPARSGHAQTAEQREWCDGKRGASLAQQIAGCTTIIESGGDSTRTPPAAFFNRGNAHSRQGEYDLAIQDFDQAIKLDPRYADAFNSRGMSYHSKGQNDRAIQDFDQAIKLDPSLVSAFFHRGTAYSAEGQHERAIQDFDQAIRLNPNYGSALSNRCLSRATIGRLQDALSDCNAALWLRPNRGRATTLNVRGITYLKLKQLDAAIADFDAALKLAPHSASSLYGRGVAKLKKGDATGGNADIIMAKAIKADIADEFARHGIQ